MNMKKILALLLAAVMVFALAACGGEKNKGDEGKVDADFKVGFIFLHDENSTYDKNFIDAAKAVQKELGLTDEQVLFKINIPETAACYEAALELVDAGCDVIFGDSFGFESHLLKAAQENPEVQFCHATGTNAKTAGVANYHNAFASIYEGRYLAGVAAGMKLNEMIKDGKFTAEEAKMGYVGAFPYAEVISGFSSFYLGAKSVCPTVTMEVKYTNSWFDIAKEKEAAQALIQSGCKLISQHADSEGAPKACEENNIPNVAYNINTASIGPNTALISSKISWEPYMKLMIESVMNGKEIPADYTGTLATGSVQLTELNEKVAAAGTQEALDATIEKLKNGEIHVFDTSAFTVGGKALDENTLADVVPDEKYEADTKVVSDGYFHESEYRSAPYFFMQIDGITGVIPE
ncbi:MAG: BMP family ABC transporter substrate-binding protein [Acutalibacteraceae bacterium]|nr:BMP family ABC transporter substrate-binding protein [Acutalibacteraceae bacterium]